MLVIRRWPVVVLLSLLATSILIFWNLNYIPTPSLPAFRTSTSPSKSSLFPPLPEGCFVSLDHKILGDVDVCANFPSHRLSEVQIVVKTGYAERDRLETLLTTFGSCISNILIVSDAPDRIAGHEVVDVLADLAPSYTQDNPDWAAYTAQLTRAQSGERVDKSPEGHRLDRFKFLPMVDRAYASAPKAKWFVFFETDIYFFWDTLFRLLDRLNANERHYLGSPASGTPDFWFGYGGAGIVLSGRLVRDLVKNGRQKLSVKYEELAKADPNGDAILGYAIDRELGHRLGHIYPTMPGEALEGLRIDRESKWCTPLANIHYVNPEQMTALWAWERCRFYSGEPITYSTFLDFGVTPLLRKGSLTPNWHNAADGGWESLGGNPSTSHCSDACSQDQRCLQFMYRDNTCFHSEYIQLGRAVPEEITSGWDLAKLKQHDLNLDHQRAPACNSTDWLTPRIGKPFD